MDQQNKKPTQGDLPSEWDKSFFRMNAVVALICIIALLGLLWLGSKLVVFPPVHNSEQLFLG